MFRFNFDNNYSCTVHRITYLSVTKRIFDHIFIITQSVAYFCGTRDADKLDMNRLENISIYRVFQNLVPIFSSLKFHRLLWNTFCKTN